MILKIDPVLSCFRFEFTCRWWCSCRLLIGGWLLLGVCRYLLFNFTFYLQTMRAVNTPKTNQCI